MFFFAITLLILGLFGASIVRRHLHEAKLLRLREISHKERMVAMERGLPVAEADATKIDSLLSEGQRAGTNSDRMTGASIHWVRLAALALGLITLFSGFGIMPGFYYQSETEISGMWPIGVIPIFIGMGLLIFVRLSRGWLRG